jgi:hypothetical protein
VKLVAAVAEVVLGEVADVKLQECPSLVMKRVHNLCLIIKLELPQHFG